MELNNFKPMETMKFSDVKSMKHFNEDVSDLLFLDSPALEIFKDFKKTSPLVIFAEDSVNNAKKKMRLANKDIIFVVNSSDDVIGVIDLHYAESVELQRLAQNSGINVADMSTNDAKLDISKVRMISYDMLADAKIGHILNTLLKENRHQILISDKDENGEDYVRGYFALSYIKKKLNLDLTSSLQKDGVASISKNIK